jgi:hypothetical protein
MDHGPGPGAGAMIKPGASAHRSSTCGVRSGLWTGDGAGGGVMHLRCSTVHQAATPLRRLSPHCLEGPCPLPRSPQWLAPAPAPSPLSALRSLVELLDSTRLSSQ